MIKQDSSGAIGRRKLFTKGNTFWAFFGHYLDADGGCKEAVKKLQAHVKEKKEVALLRGWNNSGAVQESRTISLVAQQMEKELRLRLKNNDNS